MINSFSKIFELISVDQSILDTIKVNSGDLMLTYEKINTIFMMTLEKLLG